MRRIWLGKRMSNYTIWKSIDRLVLGFKLDETFRSAMRTVMWVVPDNTGKNGNRGE